LSKYLFIFLFSFSTGAASARQTDSYQDTTIQLKKDTTVEKVAENKLVPEKDQAEYISRFTRYGLKNLFSQFSYNPALPYSAQVNPKSEWFMQDYLKRHSKNLLQLKSFSLPYFHLIDNVLSQYGLPTELKYLAVIESNLKTSATSRVGAAGPWQFMPATAMEYGLKINGRLDERRDYLKSSHAAARLLLNLYNDFQDWLLVIAAYNGGGERVRKAVIQSGSRDFWVLQHYLPEESRNHVKKFIATHYIMEGTAEKINNDNRYDKQAGNIGNRDINVEELAGSETMAISGKFTSAVLAARLNMDLRDFNRYNPEMDQIIQREGQYDLILPDDKMKIFLENKYSILNDCVQTILHADDIPPVKTVIPEKQKKSRP
jgi:membrane-bound lytic murein transglycosylase D